MKPIWPSIVVTCFLTGCAASSLGDRSGDDRIVLTDAATRAITVVKVETSGDGRRVKPQRVVCAEPSPDIAKAVSSAIEASLKAKGDYMGQASAELEGSFNRSFTESIAQLGSRLATIQLLRDELSDLCRAYANGAVSSITYTLRLSRLDKKMITLLVSEASAGALSRALVSVNGSASTGGQASPEKLKAAEGRITEAAKAITEAAKALNDANVKQDQARDNDAKALAKKEVSKAEENLRIRFSELNDRVLEKWALETRGSGLLASSTAAAVAGLNPQSVSALDLRAIHRAYLDDDDLGTLLDACLTSMEDNATEGNIKSDNTSISTIQDQINKKESALLSAESEAGRLGDAPANPTERKQMDDAWLKADVLRLELSQLKRTLEDMNGSRDRTGLLSFCRRDGGMQRITRLMSKKISDRYQTENTRNYIELCKAAIASESVPSTTKDACVKELLHINQSPAEEPHAPTPSNEGFGPPAPL